MRSTLFFCLSGFLYISSVFSTPTTECEQQQCVIVIDVGSTGSRLHAYSYDLDKTNSPINITERFSKKIKPGFSTIEPDKNTVDAYLTNLFSGLTSSQKTPVYFYATAGMRLLSQDKQQKFYTLVNNWFQSNAWQLASAKTINGNDEGMYGWLALNYQVNNLATDKPESIGFMDMGGASVEIAFPIDKSSIDDKNIKMVNLYGHHFKLFVQSFLGLGQTEVLHQYLDTPSCFVKDYTMPIGDKAQGDAYLCKKEVSSLMDIHHVTQVIQPTLSNNTISKWYTGGGLSMLVKSPPLNFPTNSFTSEELISQANTAICSRNWEALKNQFPSDDYLYSNCFSSAYYSALLDSYGIEGDVAIHYLPSNQNADWTLGVVLYPKETAETLIEKGQN